jgi:hypothetical protein
MRVCPRNPCNSETEDENYHLFDKDTSTDDGSGMKMRKGGPMEKFKKIDKRVFELSNFNLKILQDFPYKFREGEMPTTVLKMKKVELFPDI